MKLQIVFLSAFLVVSLSFIYIPTTRTYGSRKLSMELFSIKNPFKRFETALNFKADSDVGSSISVGKGKVAPKIVVPEPLEASPTQKKSLLEKISMGAIPIATSLGFALTPSSKLTTRFAGAAVGSVTGVLIRAAARRKLLDDLEKQELLDDGNIGDNDDEKIKSALELLMKAHREVPLNLQIIKKVARRKEISSENLSKLHCELFEEILWDLVKKPSFDFTEFYDIYNLASELYFTKEELGQAFAGVAIRLLKYVKKTDDGFAKASPGVIHSSAVIYFLMDKILADEDDDYYRQFVKLTLCFVSSEECEDLVIKNSIRLIADCVYSVLDKPEAFESDEIADTINFLKTSTFGAERFERSEINEIIEELMKLKASRTLKPYLKFFEEDRGIEKNLMKFIDYKKSGSTDGFQFPTIQYEKLDKACELLYYNKFKMNTALESVTVGQFEIIANATVDFIIDDPSTAAYATEYLYTIIRNLHISKDIARSIISARIYFRHHEFNDSVRRVYEVSGKNPRAIYNTLVDYSNRYEGLKALVGDIMTTVPMPVIPLFRSDRMDVYEMEQEKRARDGEPGVVDDGIFDISDNQKYVIQRQIKIPKIMSYVTQLLDEKQINDDSKQAYDKMLREADLDDKEWTPTKNEFFYTYVMRMIKSSAIPTASDMEYVQNLQNFLDVKPEDAKRIRLELFGEDIIKLWPEFS